MLDFGAFEGLAASQNPISVPDKVMGQRLGDVLSSGLHCKLFSAIECPLAGLKET